MSSTNFNINEEYDYLIENIAKEIENFKDLQNKNFHELLKYSFEGVHDGYLWAVYTKGGRVSLYSEELEVVIREIMKYRGVSSLSNGESEDESEDDKYFEDYATDDEDEIEEITKLINKEKYIEINRKNCKEFIDYLTKILNDLKSNNFKSFADSGITFWKCKYGTPEIVHESLTNIAKNIRMLKSNYISK